jgi:hypothetical protein
MISLVGLAYTPDLAHWVQVMLLHFIYSTANGSALFSNTANASLHFVSIAGHRHRGRCHRHWHSGILYLSPVPEYSGSGLDLLILVPDWFWHRNFFCSFRYRTDWIAQLCL